MSGPNIVQLLFNAGLNAFGAQLLCESLLKSPMAAELAKRSEPLRFELPIRRSDCPGWLGVEVTLRPIPDDGLADFYVHRNNGRAVFVKEAAFFAEEGGHTEPWGQAWTRVRARDIEHARAIGEENLP